MFQFGSLVLLCGLLIGTSESLLGDTNLGNVVNNVLNSPSGALPQNLNLQQVEPLQQATSWPLAKNSILESLNTLDLGGLKDLTSLNGLLLRVNKLTVLDVQAGLSSNGKDIELKLPLAVDLSVVLPLIGSTADVSVTLDIINSLTVQQNAKTGLPEVTIGKCFSDKNKISISLLGRRFGIINKALDLISTLLTNTVSTLLQNVLCPVLQDIFSILNGNAIQSLLSNLTGQLPVSI